MPDPMVPVGDGHTALAEEDRRGLIPSYIATRSELFEAEERNISRALLGRPPTIEQVLDDAYLRSLHHDMFGDVWDWAGHYRTRDTNIGITFERIPGAVRALVLDARTWVEFDTYPTDELSTTASSRSTRSPTATAATAGSPPTIWSQASVARYSRGVPSRGRASTSSAASTSPPSTRPIRATRTNFSPSPVADGASAVPCPSVNVDPLTRTLTWPVPQTCTLRRAGVLYLALRSGTVGT